MVYKIMQTKYKVFVDSLIITLLIMTIAFSLGMFVESYRTNKIVDYYKSYEIEALDLKLQNYYYQIMDDTSCTEAINQNFIFADNLYNRGLEIEKYEESNQITDDIANEKRRYVLLKTELWLNSILLKKKCNEPFDTVVYFYSSDNANTLESSKQEIISNILGEIKKERGNSIILLPIAGDLKTSNNQDSNSLGSVDLQLRIYNITSLPAILINEKTILEGFHTKEEIEKHLTKQ